MGITTDETKIRTNCGGQSCPAYCVTDHDQLLIEEKPMFGYTDGHYSDYMGSDHTVYRVKISKHDYGTTRESEVRVDSCGPSAYLSADEAEAVASDLAAVPAATAARVGLTDLIDHLRVAAAIVRETSTNADV